MNRLLKQKQTRLKKHTLQVKRNYVDIIFLKKVMKILTEIDVLGLGAFLPENKPGESNYSFVDNLNLLKAITEKEKN